MTDELQSLINGYYSAAVAHNACGGDFGSTEALNAAESDIETFLSMVLKEGYRTVLNSLHLGVDVTDGEGAGVALMSTIEGHTTVLACRFTENGQGNVFRVSV